MSLIRQIWLLLLGALALAFIAGGVVNVTSMRATLQTQLDLKNSDNATALAQVLSQQRGERELMDLTLAAQFDTGYYRRIRYSSADGKTVLARDAAAGALRAPAWFIALVPIESTPGIAQVSDGWKALGTVEVVSQEVYAYDELWRASLQSAAALGVVGVLAALFAALAVGRIRRPLDDTVRQAASLERGEYLSMPEPGVPEMRRLTRAMNSMVQRLRTVFEGQAAQVESLRRQSSLDLLTGLANRTHFTARLAAALQAEEGAPAGGLVLLRVRELAELNRRIGHARTDELLVAVAGAVRAAIEPVEGAFAGRLNGADFAFALPLAGVSRQTAEALVVRLRAQLAALADEASVIAGAVETRRAMPIGELFSQADLALARAEASGPNSVASAGDASAARLHAWAMLGEHAWSERLRASLAEGRIRLGSYPVVDRERRPLHLECPLRLQLEFDGPFEVAGDWLPLAVRARLTPDIDEAAVALALQAIEADGAQRCVNLSPDSLVDSGFAARLRTRLAAHPAAAKQLWLEVGEAAAAERFELVRELARQVRPLGVRFGLEHAGERLSRIERLFEAGIDYVKLDAAVTREVGAEPGRAAFVTGLATMLHSLQLQVIAEGVVDAGDAAVLWQCGVDGMTGPWVSEQQAR